MLGPDGVQGGTRQAVVEAGLVEDEIQLGDVDRRELLERVHLVLAQMPSRPRADAPDALERVVADQPPNMVVHDLKPLVIALVGELGLLDPGEVEFVPGQWQSIWPLPH